MKKKIKLIPGLSVSIALRSHGGEPRKIVTDKLRSYGVAHRELKFREGAFAEWSRAVA
jgi:transposase-like protein